MTLNEQQYQRVACWLDGQDVELSDEELAVGREIRSGQAQLADSLQVAAPQAVLDRAQRRVSARLARSARPLGRYLRPVAAAAAAVLVAAVYFWPGQPGVERPAGTQSADMVASVYDGLDENMDLDLLSTQLNELAADIATSAAPEFVEAGIEDIQRDLDMFWLEDAIEWPDEI